MTAPYTTNRVALRNRVPTPLGQISNATVMIDAPGLPYSSLRIWGSYAIVILLDGLGRYRDANDLRAAIHPGDLIVVFPDIGQTYGPEPGHVWSELHVIFSGPVFDAARLGGLLDPKSPIHRLEPLEQWLPRLDPFLRDIPRTAPGKAREACRLLSLLTEMLLPADPPPLSADWLAAACHLLEADLTNALSLGQVAARVGLPYETFRKRFRAQIGVSPAHYHSLRRIEAASSLLEQGALTTSQIAEALGYADEFIFAKRFKQIKGLTPHQFRRKAGERESSPDNPIPSPDNPIPSTDNPIPAR